MLNAPAGESVEHYCSEASSTTPQLIALCKALAPFRRVVFCVGGSAKTWGLPSMWDTLVTKCIALVASFGYPVIDGCKYLDPLPKTSSGGHIAKSEASSQALAKMWVELRNLAYSIWPHGAFATCRIISSSDASKNPAFNAS